jgi:hypothetical protein
MITNARLTSVFAGGKKVLHLIPILIGLGTLFASGFAGAQTVKDTFPRLGLMLIGGDGHRYHEADYQDSLARFDVAVLNMVAGWSKGSNQLTPAENQRNALNSIRKLNPDIVLFNYTTLIASPDERKPSFADVFDKLNQETGPTGNGGTWTPNDWWARNANGDHKSDWPGKWSVNITSYVTRDASGLTFPEWFARRNYERIFRDVPEWDGIYHDSVFYAPRLTVDWRRSGRNTAKDDQSFWPEYRRSHRRQWDEERRLMPGKLMAANMASWAKSTEPGVLGSWQLPEYEEQMDAGFLEHMMGKSWSGEKNRGWEAVMRWYRIAMSVTKYPNRVIFNIVDEDRDGAGYYQFFRYGFASVLMDNGYFDFSPDSGYGGIAWFDEYDLAGQDTTQWLGRAVDPPQDRPWQKGIYRREFENGLVLVNPRGNGTQTVQIEEGFSRISGTQDPVTNNGQAVSSVTLKARDGILLVRDGGGNKVAPTRPMAPRLMTE